ncbi:uromodulin-like [Ostrea edulis]|uniref:uromodulin-like n=1 Tax=Ostrea edulis TaxID=37623 RepID=UPI0024AFD705|nr:uromodulin-like [Ostrea edulis]
MKLLMTLFVHFVCCQTGDATYYCNVPDPCGQADSSNLFEPMARYENCSFDTNSANLCDRYISPQWYRVDDTMLTHCPSLLSCGTLYPVWLNGTLPAVSEGSVTRTACKVGFSDCCSREYSIQIRNCGSFYAYCLGALDLCPERYCFGEHGECELTTTATAPTSSSTAETTTTTDHVVPISDHACSADPCIESNIKTLTEPDSRGKNCEYNQDTNYCDNLLTPGWYKPEFPMVTSCPSLLSCGAIYPVWLNGSLPNLNDGVVQRTACKTGFGNCCSKTYDIKVRNCGGYTAYCLKDLDSCPERYCFGQSSTCEKTGRTEDSDSEGDNDNNHETMTAILGGTMGAMVVIFIAMIFIVKGRFGKRELSSKSRIAPDGQKRTKGKTQISRIVVSPPPPYTP